MTCGKRFYSSRYDARTALLLIWRKGLHREMSTYHCPDCQGWHLTKKKRKYP